MDTATSHVAAGRRGAALVAMLLGASRSAVASAAPPPVVVTLAVAPDDVPRVPARIAAMLAASLAPAGVLVRAEPAPEAAASIELHPEGEGMRIVVVDAVTRKLAERTISLAGVPDDARALTVASAADGLLRASWLETLADPALDPPAPVAAVAASSLRTVGDGPTLGVRGAADVATGGATLLGGDAVLTLPVAGPLAADVALGARLVPARTTPHGSIDGHAATGGLGLAWRATRPRAPVRVTFGPTGSVAWVTFAGAAPSPARVGSAGGLGLSLGAALDVALRVAPRWWLATGLSAEGVLLAVVGRDAGQTGAAFDGAVLGLRVGIAAQP